MPVLTVSVLSSKTRNIGIDTCDRAETFLILIVHSRLTLGACSAVSVLPRTSSVGVLATRKTQGRALLGRILTRLAYITLGDVDRSYFEIESTRLALDTFSRSSAPLVATGGA